MVCRASLDRACDDFLSLLIGFVLGFALDFLIEHRRITSRFLLDLLQYDFSCFLNGVAGDLLEFLELSLQHFVLFRKSVFDFSFFVCNAFFFFLYVLKLTINRVFLLIQSPLGLGNFVSSLSDFLIRTVALSLRLFFRF